MDVSPKYEFSWNLIGDLQAGRPNLGRLTRLEVYRLMQFTLRDVIEKKYGSEAVDHIFHEAGKLAGKEFYNHVLGHIDDFNTLMMKLQDALLEMSIGILRLEKADLESGQIILTIAEDLDCSGLPELSHEVCTYDEGFIAGVLEQFSGFQFEVKEIDCWCTGDRTCRFKAQRVG
ncbi:MAG: 4-vinyl reductase [Anaerolineales bacterium]|nr:4-vinyl reductase [Anaerolineales bacterium]